MSATPSAPPPAVLRAATATSVAVVAAALCVEAVLRLLGLGWGAAAPAVLVAGLVAGLPHGAVDHLAPAFRGSPPSTVAGLARTAAVLAAYAIVAGVALLALRAAPAAGLVAFLALSVVHFGAGEVTFARLRAGRPGLLAGRRGPAVALLAGSVVVLLPVAAHPEAAAPYLHDLVPAWDGRLPTPLTTAAVALLLGAVAVAAAGLARGGERVVAAELVGLAALGWLCPPAVALGAYFGGWHAVRHTAVLVLEQQHATGRAPREALRAVGRAAALPTLAAGSVVVALWVVSAGADVHRFVATDLVVLAALTVPHAAVVWWLDRGRADAWSRAPQSEKAPRSRPAPVSAGARAGTGAA